jgi:hypothetical protein
MNNIEKFNCLFSNNEKIVDCYKFVKKIGIKYAYNLTLREKFKDACGYKLNLTNPQTFSEKIQWIKVNCHNSLITQCADKYKVRDYVFEKSKNKYLSHIYGVWDNPEKIDFDSLPLSFVLKTNHASGQVIIVKDKNILNTKMIKKQLCEWLSENYYYTGGEWAYKNISPLVMCEELLEEGIIDYKFYCFNGLPKFLYVSKGLEGNPHDAKMSFVDLKWNLTPFQRSNYLRFDNLPSQPLVFKEMLDLASKLSAPFCFVRVDLYSIKDRIVFSELTFYPNGGFAPFEPKEWEVEIGNWIKLPINSGGKV